MTEQKKPVGFNIIKKEDPMAGHKGFGIGALSLDNIAPVIIDVEAKTAVVDVGAMHARSAVEKGIKFSPNRDDVPNGKAYWLVWVTVGHSANGPYYAGVTACEMTVDREARRGYKLLPEHVNNMDKSLKGKLIVEQMDATSKTVLATFLQQHNEQMWSNSSDELKASLA